MQKKKLFTLSMVFLCMLLAACAPKLTPAQRIEKAQQVLKDQQSVAMSMAMHMDIGTEAQGFNTDITMNMQVVQSPLQLKLDIQAAQMGTGTTELYAVEQDDQMTMYMKNGDEWMKQTLDMADFKAEMGNAMNVQQNINTYLEVADTFTDAGTATIDGVQVVKLEGTIPADKIEQAMSATGNEDMFSSMGLDAQMLADIYAKLDATPLVIYMNAKTNLPLRYEVDMTAMMNSLFNTFAEGMDTPKVNAYTITMDMSDYNAISKIDIPAEALDAPAQ